jgi:hypothetical protein
MTPDQRTFLAEHVFSYLRGTLEVEKARQVDRLLIEAPDAAEAVSRLDQLLRAARSRDPAVFTDGTAADAWPALQAALECDTPGAWSGPAPWDDPAPPPQEAALPNPPALPGPVTGLGQGVRSADAPAPDPAADALFARIRAQVEPAGEVAPSGSTPRAVPSPARDVAAESPLSPAARVGASWLQRQGLGATGEHPRSAQQPRRRSGARAGWVRSLALAAAVLLAFALGRWWGPGGSAQDAPGLPTGDGVARAPADVALPTPAATPAAPGLVALAAPAQTLRLWTPQATPARWSLTDASPWHLTLEDGALVVEFLGGPLQETLTVHVGDHTLEVVGTMFHVQGHRGEVTLEVLDGRIAARAAGAEPVEVAGGQVWRSAAPALVVPAVEALPAEWAGTLDVAGHDARLAAVLRPSRQPDPSDGTGDGAVAGSGSPPPSTAGLERTAPGRAPVEGAGQGGRPQPGPAPRTPPGPRPPSAPTGTSTPTTPPVPSQTQPPAAESAPFAPEPWAEALEGGRSAMASRNWRAAADRLESALRTLPPLHPDALVSRLDLASIYLRQLQRPTDAERHLRRFVDLAPSDPAAPAARAELCRLVTARQGNDVRCPAGAP